MLGTLGNELYDDIQQRGISCAEVGWLCLREVYRGRFEIGYIGARCGFFLCCGTIVWEALGKWVDQEYSLPSFMG